MRNREQAITSEIDALEFELTAPDMTSFREMLIREEIDRLRDLLSDTTRQ